MITAYFVGETFFSEDGINYHLKDYELSDMRSFKVNKDTVKSNQLTLSYNLLDSNCCLKVNHIKNGIYTSDVIGCESVNPLELASDQVDIDILKKYVSSKISFVLNQFEKEEIDLPWEQ